MESAASYRRRIRAVYAHGKRVGAGGLDFKSGFHFCVYHKFFKWAASLLYLPARFKSASGTGRLKTVRGRFRRPQTAAGAFGL
ncbi:hypothetical protein [Kingella potus]|uniref:hypothetical protein n=1 Tax=Kingella potus TaxID=265175 RepID=UPI001FD39B6E|nr:hypothetical protein [Kingella potus]UOP00901.1 hypothetical protein LVJ84_00250 [Kingella potus]